MSAVCPKYRNLLWIAFYFEFTFKRTYVPAGTISWVPRPKLFVKVSFLKFQPDAPTKCPKAELCSARSAPPELAKRRRAKRKLVSKACIELGKINSPVRIQLERRPDVTFKYISSLSK